MHYGRIPMAWEITDYDLEFYPVWVRTPAHTEPVMTPLYCEFWYGYMVDGIRRGAGYISLPTTLGYYWKLYKGHGYLTRARPLDSEIPAREARYREIAGPIIDDPFAFCDKIFGEMDTLMEPFTKLNLETMSREELIAHVHDMIYMHTKAIYLYFQGWFGVTPLPALFQKFAQDLTGLKATDPLYSKLTISTDNPLYRSNRGIADLARLALDSKLETNLALPDNEVVKAMGQSSAGKQWLEAMGKFLGVHGC
jgi:hypothetical protein